MDKELGKDQSIYLDLFDLTSGERYMLNRKLSFRERLSGKIIAEDVVINGSVFVKKGSVVTAEEAQIIGGLGSAVAEIIAEQQPAKLARVGMKDRFGESGDPLELMEYFGLDAKHIRLAAHHVLDK